MLTKISQKWLNILSSTVILRLIFEFTLQIRRIMSIIIKILGPAAAPPFWRAQWRHHPVFVLEHDKTNKNSKDTIFL
jgi:hypothetical protein